jgi:hypothetical protein
VRHHLRQRVVQPFRVPDRLVVLPVHGSDLLPFSLLLTLPELVPSSR